MPFLGSKYVELLWQIPLNALTSHSGRPYLNTVLGSISDTCIMICDLIQK